MSQLDLLMVHADDHRPVLSSGLPAGVAQTEDRPEDRGSPSHLGDDAADQNDLECQRWGVIVPEGPQGKRLLSLIEPLIQARRAAQGGREIRVYTTPPKLDLVQAMEWKRQNFDTCKDTTEDLPRYQLILGDLDEVPLAIQQVQATDNYVGRLAFADDQGYQAYVDKVLRWEKQPSALAQARSLLFTVHDQTAATDSGYRSLVTPGLEVARKRQQSRQFNASEVVELGDQTIPNPDELLREVQKPTPAMLFTLSHGLGAPRGGWRSPQEQRQLQGAMSFGSEGVLSGEPLGRLAAKPFLPGGIWFMLACYGAGTPESSAYQKWLGELAKVGQFRGQPQSVMAALPKPGERPFIAAVPQAVLRNSDGPLAFIGHVDLAWTYSFAELDSGKTDPKPGRFMEILRYILKGDRVGVAFHALMRYFGSVDTELTSLYDCADDAPPTPSVAAKRGHLWMLRQDLAGYVLLGDPAARLPLQPHAVLPAEPPYDLAQAVAQQFSFPVSVAAPASPSAAVAAAPAAAAAVAAPSPPAALPESLPLSIDKLEEAFGQLFIGDRSLKDLALDLQLSRQTLQRLFDLYRQGGRRALGVNT